MDEGLLTNTEFRSMPLNDLSDSFGYHQTGRKYKEELLECGTVW